MKWHADSLWPFYGAIVPNMWIALSPVNRENGQIEFVAGYHRYCRDNGVRYGPAGNGRSCPDFQADRSNPDFPFRFVTWDLEPGDAVLFHFDIPHYSKGNDSETLARAGLAFRVIGNDVTWCPRQGLAPIPGIDVTSQPEGVHPEHAELLPYIWRRGQKSSLAA
jgi:ectoine hydroxylase-related dioxygenase (phytanoyl-CoA dioxygenase family)